MVDLVLKRTREEAARGHDLRHVVHVEILARHLRGTIYGTAEPRKAQAPFLVELAALAGYYLGIEEDERHRDNRIKRLVLLGLAPFWNVDYAHPLGATDLLRREPHSLRSMHRGNHVDGERTKLIGDNCDWLRLLAEDRFAVLVDLEFQELNTSF